MSEKSMAEVIDQAIASLEENDFHSQWQDAKQLSRQIAQWGDHPVPYLVNRLRTASDLHTQWFLVRVLSQFDQIEGIEAIAHLLATTQNEDLKIEVRNALIRIGNSAIDTVSDLLSLDQPIERRIVAVKVLAHIRRSATIEPLLSVVKDDNAEIRAVAIEALGSFHDPRITPVLLAALEAETDADVAICIEAIRTLGRRSDLLSNINLVDPLQQCLRHDHSQIAAESAIALGRLGTEDAVVALGQALVQPVATSVKAAIVRALGWIDTENAIRSLAIAFEQSAPMIMPTIKPEIARALSQTHQHSLRPYAAKPLIAWLGRSVQSADNFLANPFPDVSTDNSPNLKQSVVSALARLGQTDAITVLIPLLADSDSRIRIHAHSALQQIDYEEAESRLRYYLLDEKNPIKVRNAVRECLNNW
ncbi:HEAT repeat domain-containing protein [Synechococcus sp. PCC 7335]|uniref:HEAT repeat domain-containing protein n=1 Tax=Synechococcus sp. (strain ATCC 29403 / PCC 7335) TaxID=91464 RepID=UPI0018DCA22F|nr:HEAT repeat domain-containing protein [Synechococcus sp. PCC 7335]